MSTVNELRERLLAGLPCSERNIEVSGVRTALLEAGDGPPLVLLHGGIECGGVYWAPVIERLAARYRLIVPDLPGLGQSAPIERLDPGGFDGWFGQLIRATTDESPLVIAHSLAGPLVARFASRQSNSMRRIVICGAPGIASYRMPLRLQYVAVRFAIRPTARNNKNFERFVLLDREGTRARDPHWFDAFSEYARTLAVVPHTKRAMWQLIGSGKKRIPDEDLRRIPVPVDLLWGRDDRVVPIRVAEDARRRLGWPLQVVPGAAHVPHMEQPDAFVEAIAALDPQPSGTHSLSGIRERITVS